FGAHVNVLLAAGLGLVRTPADRQEEHLGGRRVEVLVEPHLGWHEHAAGTPIDPLDGLAFLPHERIAMALQDQHVNSWSMTMGLLVGADGPAGAMRAHRPVDHCERGAESAD